MVFKDFNIFFGLLKLIKAFSGVPNLVNIFYVNMEQSLEYKLLQTRKIKTITKLSSVLVRNFFFFFMILNAVVFHSHGYTPLNIPACNPMI